MTINLSLSVSWVPELFEIEPEEIFWSLKGLLSFISHWAGLLIYNIEIASVLDCIID